MAYRNRKPRLSVDSATAEHSKHGHNLDALVLNTLTLHAPVIVLPKGGAVSDSEMDGKLSPGGSKPKRNRRLRSLEDILIG